MGSDNSSMFVASDLSRCILVIPVQSRTPQKGQMIKILANVTIGSICLIFGMALVCFDVFTILGAVLAINFLIIAAVGLFYQKDELYEQPDDEEYPG